ncbi:farnesyl cysteine-carboxyl methyltransferase [Vanrija albida]|uniref:Protein-S-isoprenylcysteine O-methyltransferase n=1 Tax=Vanrija albida TaxID=181172 RepID=A0ABR3Q7N7_9TREE
MSTDAHDNGVPSAGPPTSGITGGDPGISAPFSVVRNRFGASNARPLGDIPNLTPPQPALAMPESYQAKDTIPNTPLAASVISAALGAIAGSAILLASFPFLRWLGAETWVWPRPQLAVYIAAMGTFHLLEFWTTAGWNYRKLSVDAFLLNNTAGYHLAHFMGLTEYFISSYFWPNKFEGVWASWPVLLGVVAILLLAQSFRSLAMVHAADSFSHIVKAVKLDDHTLVTSGVYGYVRHPSYVGFFYWAVATQLLLSNIVSTVAFVVILGRFFSSRITNEEKHLIRFFGNDYIEYKKRVGSGLPFLVK